MWDLIRELVQDGVTIFLTTQYLDEADQLADRIGVLDHGTLIAHGTPAELKRLIPGGHIRLQLRSPDSMERAEPLFAGARRDEAALALLVPSDGGVGSLRSLLHRIDGAGLDGDVIDLSVHTPDLDDVFLALTAPSGTVPRSPTDKANPS